MATAYVGGLEQAGGERGLRAASSSPPRLVVVGGLAAGSAVLAIAAAGAVAAIAAFVCLALEVGPPREHMRILVCLLSASLPLEPASAWARGGPTLAEGALACSSTSAR